MKKLVWIDLDGVMVNLDKGLKDKFNFEFPKERNDYNKQVIHKLWDDIANNHLSFWSDLEPTPYYKELYQAILKVCPTPNILSATPEPYTGDNDEHCREHKRIWIAKHLGLEQFARSCITKSKLKQHVIQHFPGYVHILVDDHPGNIERWREAGGIGIHHTDINKTLDELKGHE